MTGPLNINDLTHMREVHIPNLRAQLNNICSVHLSKTAQDLGTDSPALRSLQQQYETTTKLLNLVSQEIAKWEAIATAITDPYQPIGGPTLPNLPPKDAPKQRRRSSPSGSSA
jgi:hypothetical protein